MDCNLPGSSVCGDSPGKYAGVGCYALLQGIFPIHGSNPGLPHCTQIIYHLSHEGSPRILEWVAYPFSRGSSWPRNWTGASCIAGRFFTNWAIREALLNSWYEFIPIKYGTIWFTYWGSPKKFICINVNLLKQVWKPLWATTGFFNKGLTWFVLARSLC